MDNTKSDLKRLAGLWVKKSKKSGDSYLSGKINDETNIVVFKNTRKTKDTEPDYIAFTSEIKKQNGTHNPNIFKEDREGASFNKFVPPPPATPQATESEDDIPF